MKKLLILLLCLCLLPCALAEETVTYENGNMVQYHYYDDGTGVKIIYYSNPNEEGLYIVEEIALDGSHRSLSYQNDVDTVRWEFYENDLLTLRRYLMDDDNIRIDHFDETGALIEYEISYALPNAEGYHIDKRFLADGTLDHEWWWGVDDLYHEIWFVDGQVDSYTYWWYNVDGHDVKYEEHHKEYSKYRYYDYDANGELQMSESETVLH